MNRLKDFAIRLFGEDYWREWCEVLLAVVLAYWFDLSMTAQIGLVLYIFGRSAFRRLLALQRSVTAIAARPPQPIERPALTPAQAAAARAARGVRP